MAPGIKLKLLREKKKLSQEELAHMIGVVQATVGNWEKGKSIKLEYIQKISDVLNTPLSYFLENEEKVANEPKKDLIENDDSCFKITIKAPNNLYEELNKKMDFIINRFNSLL